MTNRIINGSNNDLAPLYYDQPGVDSLHSQLAATMANCRAFGMVVGAILMTTLTGDALAGRDRWRHLHRRVQRQRGAVRALFVRNPGHYKIGEYDGLSTLFIPKRGFIHVLITVEASELVTV